MKKGNYTKDGYCFYPNFFEEKELLKIEPIIVKFHNHWLKEYASYYNEGSINSHGITSSNYLNNSEKDTLFEFIAQKKLVKLLEFENLTFLNTQLFFDPKNKKQENYWHRDVQYTGLSEIEQKKAIQSQNIVHVRIPFTHELGIELIPKTHKKWDSKEAYEVRNSLNSKKPSDSIKNSKLLSLNRKDVLLFSANMIHRGIYGKNRFSLDIIFFEKNPAIFKFRDAQNLPTESQLLKVECPEVF